MQRWLAMIAVCTAMALSACQGSGDIRYTGTNEGADEGDWIKDPEADATTRNRGGSQDTTRTRSNRVDIPVLEYAQVAATTYGAHAYNRAGYDGRYVRSLFQASKQVDFTNSERLFIGFDDEAMSEGVIAGRNHTLYPSLLSEEELNSRTGNNRVRAYSAQDQPWIETGRVRTEGMRSNSWVEALNVETELEALRGRSSLESGWASRVVGLHLWKYADREVVGDSVEVTYTLVYYNANDYDTGPTEIDEPVPYYTEYMQGTATLPKEGTSVEYIVRPGARNLLRWKFPKGIKSEETNRMTYKVTVRLDDGYAPKEAEPGLPPGNR